MSKLGFVLYGVAFSVGVAGCSSSDDSAVPPTPTIETINVSDHLTDGQRYNIDLRREDAVYFLAPNPDASRLTVTCPSLATLSFDEYLTIRIRPTGVKYDPSSDGLQLANGALPREVFSEYAGQAAICWVACSDPVSANEWCQEQCPEY